MSPGLASSMDVAFSRPRTSGAHKPYDTPVAHWLDLFAWLDSCVQREVERRKDVAGSGELQDAAWMRFAAVSAAEVDAMLSAASDELPTPSTTVGSLEMSRLAGREAATNAANGSLPLLELVRLFNLSPLERDALIIACAPDLDARYERLYGYLQDDLTRRRATPSLIFNLLGLSRTASLQARLIFSPHAPLLRYQLLRHVDEAGAAPLPSRALQVDERIVSYLVGEGGVDARISAAASWPSPQASPDDELVQRLAAAIEACRGATGLTRKPMFYLRGPEGAGKQRLAQAAVGRLGLPLLVIDCEQLLQTKVPWRQAMTLVFREGLLTPAALYLQRIDRVLQCDEAMLRLQDLARAVAELGGVTFLSGSGVWAWPGVLDEHLFITLDIAQNDEASRQRMWRQEFAGELGVDEQALRALARQYRLSPRQVERAGRVARDTAAWRGGTLSLDDVRHGVRAQTTRGAGTLGRVVAPRHGWDELILPPDQCAQLREVCGQARLGVRVYEDWGMGRRLSYGRGLNVLFSGPPGTGKTLAAEVIARELGLDLLKIDLSQVVSKYIGETEKNLHRVFEQAQQGGAVLFFDEADALFGKRSEVKDAHDRYSNIETAYLLQKLEEYEGVVLLASNLRANMDDAFVRRMNFVVEFPFPEEEYRERIWHSLLPPELPRGEDVDFRFMARQFKLAGGNIKNVVVAAAFLAAAEERPLVMRHLILATKREYQKLGWMCGKADFGPWYDEVADGT